MNQPPIQATARGSSRGLRAILGGAIAAAALFTLACTPTTQVTVASPSQATGIAVTGSGSVVVKPDVARLNLGVEITDASVAAARARAAEAATKLQEALAQNGVEEQDIRTQYLNISPQYTYPSDRGDGTPKIVGYVVSNQLQITIRNLDKTSDILDAAIEAGGDAVRVHGIDFTVDQPEQYLAQARADAVEDARTRAEELA